MDWQGQSSLLPFKTSFAWSFLSYASDNPWYSAVWFLYSAQECACCSVNHRPLRINKNIKVHVRLWRNENTLKQALASISCPRAKPDEATHSFEFFVSLWIVQRRKQQYYLFFFTRLCSLKAIQNSFYFTNSKILWQGGDKSEGFYPLGTLH